jgi:hypothetical protein
MNNKRFAPINDEEFDRYKNFLIENNVDVSLIMNEL